MRTIHSIRSAALTVAMSAVLAASPAAMAQEEPDVQSFERRLQRLENIVNSGQLAEIVQQLDALSGEIRELRGEIESQAHRLDSLRERQRNLYADLDRRLRELEVTGRVMEPEEGDGETAQADTGSDEAAEVAVQAALEANTGDGDGDGQEGERDPAAERSAYDEAFALLREGRYAEAADAFTQFLEDYPDGPYADNARYWLGESRYVTRDFTPALEAFRQVVENHPGSAKVPDARLKLGYTLYEMARYDEAREVLQTVVKQHPESAVARLAEERLVKMKNEGH